MTKIDVVSGFLGAGKTTLIKKLLKEALDGSKTVLIENEFGEIGIDGGFLQESGIEIKEMNSGCICCSLVGDFGTSLKEVINTYAPERILIEPSGVGKLSDVLKAVEDVAKDLLQDRSFSHSQTPPTFILNNLPVLETECIEKTSSAIHSEPTRNFFFIDFIPEQFTACTLFQEILNKVCHGSFFYTVAMTDFATFEICQRCRNRRIGDFGQHRQLFKTIGRNFIRCQRRQYRGCKLIGRCS